jgi:hypothetical protein
MPAAMSQESLAEYIPRVRNRYERMRGKRARGRVLDEFCAVSGWERKYAMKVLRGQRRSGRGPGRGGAPRRYEERVVEVLTHCWRQMEQPCGKRMAGMLPLWVRHLGGLEETVREKVLEVSAATIDRLLAGVKIAAGRKKPLVPRSDAAVKALVAIRAERWNTSEVGWTEVDTVAHCGGDMGGSFIWSLTSVEILSGWTEVRAVWNRGQAATWEGLVAIEQAQPFFLRGIDSDGGGEFLNHHLYGYLKERGIQQTRSRPYRKNDQAHVEQKNYTHVRQLLGYERLGEHGLLAPLNQLLELWSLWKNLYCTTMEQISTTRAGSKQKRQHVKRPQTPAQRLLASGQLNQRQRRRIEAHLETTNPFAMKVGIEKLLGQVWKKRSRLLEPGMGKEGLAIFDLPALRSGRPKTAIKPTKTEKAMVSSL